mgnify:CR=1 FL=1
MKEKMHLKKKDWVLIAIIIVVAGLAFFLHNLLGAKGANCVVVRLREPILLERIRRFPSMVERIHL